MDLLWFLDCPFWQKMFFVTMVVGIMLFTQFTMNITKHAKAAFEGLGIRIKNDWKKQIAESKDITNKWINRR